ncbi:MAG: hypothetical protein ACT443_01765, partial [Gemmatimonadota bacterium]
GAGPVVSYSVGKPAVQLYYSLTGNHADGSPFNLPDASLDGAGQLVFGGSGSLVWAQQDVTSPDVNVTEYVLTPPSARTVFSMAYDLDLGSSAADDQSGYDPARQLVYTYDDDGAAGVVIRRAGSNAIEAVTQYGAKRFAPSTSDRVWTAQRNAGTHLLTGRDDVQFLISTAGVSVTTAFTVYLLRSADVASLKTLADQIIAGKI